jgi:hypothetical protein
MRKEAILLLHKQEKIFGQYNHKLSIISKHSRLMLTELRYQVKIHTLSNRPREKKILQILPKYIYIFIKQKETTSNMEKTSYAKA